MAKLAIWLREPKKKGEGQTIHSHLALFLAKWPRWQKMAAAAMAQLNLLLLLLFIIINVIIIIIIIIIIIYYKILLLLHS